MYYGNDESGHIITGETSDILPEPYQDVFPSVPPTVQDPSPLTVSSGDSVPSFTSSDVAQTTLDAIERAVSYNIYPSAAAVSVFSHTLNGLDGDYGYIIMSGPDTYTADLYYSLDYEYNGSDIVLSGDVTRCHYYRYRPNSSATWEYRYEVSSLSSFSHRPTDELIYTNMVDGYPDVIPYKQHESYSLLFSIPLIIFGTYLLSSFIVRRQHV